MLTTAPRTDGTTAEARRRRFRNPIVVRNRHARLTISINLIPSLPFPQSKHKHTFVSVCEIVASTQRLGCKLPIRLLAVKTRSAVHLEGLGKWNKVLPETNHVRTIRQPPSTSTLDLSRPLTSANLPPLFTTISSFPQVPYGTGK